MDRETGWATVHGAAEVGHSLAAEQQQSGIKCWGRVSLYRLSLHCGLAVQIF